MTDLSIDPGSLSLQEKLAQLMFPRIGNNLPPISTVSEDADRVAGLLQILPVGGLCIFNGHWPHTPRTISRLQEASSIPLLICADVERGAGQQISGLSVFPDAMALSAMDSPAQSLAAARSLGLATAAESLAAGVHMVLGPVADVNSDPRNPIIATRAFSTDTAQAATLAAAYIEGCQSTGAYAMAKHFPGHGNTTEDSHESLPHVHADRDLLMERDVAPFAAAIKAGVRCIMTAHVAYPALDPTGVPATISRPILTGLLREELGFDGVIMTDSVLMSGVRDLFDEEGPLCKAVIDAGADILLDVADPVAVVDYLLQCVENGDLEESRVDQSLERIWKLKTDLHGKLGDAVFAGLDVPDEPTITAEFTGLADQIASSSITELETAGDSSGNAGDVVAATLDSDETLGVLIVKPFDVPWDVDEQPLVGALRSTFPALQAFEISPKHGDTDEILAAASQLDHVVVAMIVRPVAWHEFGLPESQKQLVDQLAQATNVTAVSLGIPAILGKFPQIQRRICAFSNVEVSQLAVAKYLTGA